MANQLGVRLHAGPGVELIADSLAHVVRAELGAAAALSGITSRTWVAEAGRFRAEDAGALMITGVGPYQVCTGVVVVENTHNFGGGTVQSLEEIRKAREVTRAAGVAMHLDGARLWNAHVATGISLDDYGRQFDTVSVCLSKGLGAPVGSVLVGTTEAMAEARVWRKRFGGGMRQAGILAAAGLYALDHNIDRLRDDHERAHRAAVAMAQAAPGSVDPEGVQTNIVIADVSVAGWTAPDFVAAALDRGVRLYAVGPAKVRFVWHLDVDDLATDHAISVVNDLLIRERSVRGPAGR
jgi:threonine aldolase